MIGQPSIADIRALVREAVENAVPALIKQMHDDPPRGDLTRAFLGFQGGTLVWRQLPDRPPVAGDPVEWDQHVDGTAIHVVGGQAKYSGVLYPSSASTDEYEVDFSGVEEGASRYLVVEILLSSGTVDVVLSETRPVDAPTDSVIRVALAIWKMQGGVPVRTRILHSGAIQFSGIYLP